MSPPIISFPPAASPFFPFLSSSVLSRLTPLSMTAFTSVDFPSFPPDAFPSCQHLASCIFLPTRKGPIRSSFLPRIFSFLHALSHPVVCCTTPFFVVSIFRSSFHSKFLSLLSSITIGIPVIYPSFVNCPIFVPYVFYRSSPCPLLFMSFTSFLHVFYMYVILFFPFIYSMSLTESYWVLLLVFYHSYLSWHLPILSILSPSSCLYFFSSVIYFLRKFVTKNYF